MAARQQDYISIAREQARFIWNAINELEAMQREWVALDYGSTLENGVDSNDGIAAAAIGDVVNTTANALRALLDTGHATNLAKLL